MPIRTRPTATYGSSLTDDLDALENVSDEELERILFKEEESPESKINLATVAGMSMMGVGALYILQQMGLAAVNVSALGSTLPWIAGILIFAMGFGLFRRRPRPAKVAASDRIKPRAQALNSEARRTYGVGMAPKLSERKRRLTKTADRKVAGVAGGIAEYFGWDPTIVRIGWAAAMVASVGWSIPLYIALAIFMPKPQALSAEERIAIIRNS
jgi:phage shock protein PspC (stress-responsive transcriptional regulator)